MPHSVANHPVMSFPDHYVILGLPALRSASQDVSGQKLKMAYRAALLKYHPDKVKHEILTSKASSAMQDGHMPQYSVDQITQAYAVLSVPTLRAQYDRELLLRASAPGQGQGEKEIFRTGVEIIDLDDLEYDEKENMWYRGCRCGDERGFVVQESNLEEAADDGEVNIECRGCSLWMKVLFGVLEDDEASGGAG